MKQYEKSKFNLNDLIYLKYKFKKDNMEIDIKKVINDIWVLKYWYLNIIMNSIDSNNRVNLDNIDLSDSNKRSLEAYFKSKWFIDKIKLKWDSKKILYLNPYYSHQWKTIHPDLYEAFKKFNWDIIY